MESIRVTPPEDVEEDDEGEYEEDAEEPEGRARSGAKEAPRGAGKAERARAVRPRPGAFLGAGFHNVRGFIFNSHNVLIYVRVSRRKSRTRGSSP